MSSTRTAKDKSVFHQGRYASSPEFERGLIANLVAKRCALLPDKADRELIWFVQYLSHQDGGMAAVARDLIAKYPDQIGTKAMREIKPEQICNADQAKAIRAEFPFQLRKDFLLKGESDIQPDAGEKLSAADYSQMADDAMRSLAGIDEPETSSENHPSNYPAKEFFDLCHAEAASGLEKYLREVCLNPAIHLHTGPWYFQGLIKALRDYQKEFIAAKSAGAFTTALGQKVWEVLDYTAYSRGLTLMQGEARLGKSFAARAWCNQHPGTARFIEVASGNDDANFFRDLARGLGLGNFLNYKVGQIRERVESVLLTGDILLVLDEAQRLWPQRNIRAGFPGRIVWVMTMANAGVPVCMISTPQFFVTQKAVEKNGWNSAQLTGRISHYESLPADLSPEDLKAVAKAVLPEADPQVLQALAIYARSSARYLAAIDSIAKRSRFIAMRAGREEATTGDVRKAMQESVIPADSKLLRALGVGVKSKPNPASPLPAPGMPLEARESEFVATDAKTPPTHSRANLPALGSRRPAEFEAPLIEA